MKKPLIILLISYSTFMASFAYEGETHQYIVIEALKLLESQLNNDFPELDAYMGKLGHNEYCYWSNWVDKGEIVLGALDEDEYDPVFLGNNLMIIGQQTSALSSISHFWNPDKDLNTFYFNLPNIKLFDINGILLRIILSSHPTAYSKVKYYVNGHWPPISYIMTKDNDIWSGYNVCGYDYENGLTNLYLNGELRKKYHWYISKILSNLDKYTVDNTLVYWNNEQRKNLVYNILGRIAHLLGDMSVPAHSHTTFHAYFFALNAKDYYEDWAKDNNINYWTGEKVFKERGGYIDPYSYSENGFGSFIEYFMYCMAQTSQHYASRAINGNDIYNQSVGENKSILDTYGDKGPTTTNGNYYDHNQKTWKVYVTQHYHI